MIVGIEKKSPECFIISIDKEHPLNTPDVLEGKSVILCDDVLNSGMAPAYSLGKILTVKVKKVTTAVLVLRSHGSPRLRKL